MIDVTHAGLKISALYTITPMAHFRERSRINDAVHHLWQKKIMLSELK